MDIIWGIVIGIIVVIVGAFLSLVAWSYLTRRREYQSAGQMPTQTADPLLDNIDANRPALVYFTADWCGPCKMQQTPIIEKLKSQQPDLQVITVDIQDTRDEVAQRWGVKSLPRTFVIGHNRQIHTTNMGVANLHVLNEQLQSATHAPSGDTVQVNLLESNDSGRLSFKFLDPE